MGDIPRDIPRAGGIDNTLAFRREPYDYISRCCRSLNTDVFETRLLGRKTLCLRGRAAAEVFYDPRYFVRHGAAPELLQKTLLGTTGVQTLDDAAHRHRKAMFLALLSSARISTLGAIVRQEMQRTAHSWSHRPQIVLYDEVQQVLTRCVCAWAGVPLDPVEVPKRTAQLAATFAWAGESGVKQVRSRLTRRHAEHWVAKLIESIRTGHFKPVEDSAIDRIAAHRDLNGDVLTPHAAAVELLNVLRPTVAVSVYIVFLAHALNEFPDARGLLQSDATFADAFVQEVRRFYPFFPAVPAKVRAAFSWNGYEFPAGTRALLDLHGINHDERIWDAPDEFRPQRFLRWNGRHAYEFVPQGGGDHLQHHRCPGEGLTIELMRQAVEFLTKDIRYRLPPQDLTIDTHRLPALPKSRIVMSDIASVTEHPGIGAR